MVVAPTNSVAHYPLRESLSAIPHNPRRYGRLDAGVAEFATPGAPQSPLAIPPPHRSHAASTRKILTRTTMPIWAGVLVGCAVVRSWRSVPTRLNGVPARVLLIGDCEQHIGVAGFIEWAVTREVTPAKLSFRFPDRDHQPTGEQILAIPTNRLVLPEFQGMWIPPLRWPRDDDNARRQASSLAT